MSTTDEDAIALLRFLAGFTRDSNLGAARIDIIQRALGWGEKRAREAIADARKAAGVRLDHAPGGLGHVALTPEGVERLRRFDEGEAGEGTTTSLPPRRSVTIFYSWQRDIRAAACRTLIQEALESAAKKIGDDDSVGVEAVIDRDTQDVPGAPDIGATILAKIDAAAVFVADVTIVAQTPAGKSTPNPNVLVELGYALKALGPSRLVMVMNTAFGRPEDLPFDLRQKRALPSRSPDDAGERAPHRQPLPRALERALRGILAVSAPSAPRPRVRLSLSYEKQQIAQEHHVYALVVGLKNTSTKRIDDWELEFEFPTALLDSTVHAMKVAERSNANRSFFLLDGKKLEPLRPDQERTVRITYQMTKPLYERRAELFVDTAKARALVDGEIVETIERPIEELQDF